jgi:methionine-rich copper-binding protein CopC
MIIGPMKMSHPGTKYLLRNTLVFLSIAFLFALAPRAHAHARMVKSIPAKGAELSASPGQLDLWFNELLEDGFNTIDVFSAAELAAPKHTNLTQGKVMVDPEDRTHLIVKLSPLAPGDYVVDWRVLSRDGHSAPGRITFSIKGGK